MLDKDSIVWYYKVVTNRLYDMDGDNNVFS